MAFRNDLAPSLRLLAALGLGLLLQGQARAADVRMTVGEYSDKTRPFFELLGLPSLTRRQ